VTSERTQVGIVGAGPAGLFLSHLLALEGIESVVLERRSRQYCLARVRAGVLEHDVAAMLVAAGAGAAMLRDGLVHHGISLQVDGARHRIDFAALTGRSVVVYGQQELTRDLIDLRLAAGGDLRFEAEDVAIEDHTSDHPRLRFRHENADHDMICDVVAGCDGFHGVAREMIAASARRAHSLSYPYAWLGILAHAAPAVDELVYASHDRGFALYSMRSTAVSRLYLQVAPDERIDDWPDERIWDELDTRLGIADDASWAVNRGPTIEKSITPMRSYVSEPMSDGGLHLAGDAAHIVPPAGAKGLNLALHDVALLARAIAARVNSGTPALLERFSDDCLARVWRAEDFSLWMTRLLHRPADPFERRAQESRLRYVCASDAARRGLAENYVGLAAASLLPGPASP
jgi:p-hydroxybenzoate 3-monooxygenase